MGVLDQLTTAPNLPPLSEHELAQLIHEAPLKIRSQVQRLIREVKILRDQAAEREQAYQQEQQW